MVTRQAFDLQKAISDAWTLIWAERAKQEAPSYRPETHTYVTASDIEAQVRTFAIEQREGKAWGSTGLAYGKPMTWPPLRISTGGRRDLLGVCRDWLLRQVSLGKIESHNFGRGHISGMRFRPKGTGLSEPEKATMEAKAKRASKPRPIHFSDKSTGYECLCTATRKRSMWSRHRSQAHCTMERQRVTCPRCLKLMKETA